MDLLKKIFPWLLLLVAPYIGLLLMPDRFISDDQTTYFLAIQKNIVENGAIKPFALGENILYWFLLLFDTEVRALTAYFVFFSTLYLFSMYWSLNRVFLKDRLVSLVIATSSLAPIYVLGMTFWGFNRWGMILPRVSILWIIPLVVAFAMKLPLGRKQWLGLFISISTMIFHLSAFFLVACIYIFLILRSLKSRQFRFAFETTLFTFFILVVAESVRRSVVYSTMGFISEIPIQFIEQASSIVGREQIDLMWKASDAAFWWTLFPPRLSDVVYFLGGSFFIIYFAVSGVSRCWRSNKVLATNLLLLVVSVIVVAYGYQFFRFVGWRLLGLAPSFYEEVRAFRIIMLPLYIFAGLYLIYLKENNRLKAFIFCSILCFLPPTTLIRNLPTQLRIDAASEAVKILPGEAYTRKEYVEKSLGINNQEKEKDIETIVNIILNGNFSQERIMSTEHKLKRAGLPVLMSYQDKRLPLDRLVYWFLTFSEISKVLDSRDEKLIADTAYESNCSLVVTQYPLVTDRWSVLYEGNTLYFYQLK